MSLGILGFCYCVTIGWVDFEICCSWIMEARIICLAVSLSAVLSIVCCLCPSFGLVVNL